MADFETFSSVCAVLSDINRLKIINMLSCGSICACKILEKLNITQPTLSHHMKTLIEANLVTARKEGVWNHYSLNKDEFIKISEYIKTLTNGDNNCICKKDGIV